MSTEPTPRPPHPAACPYCGGTTVNQVEPAYSLRPAQLNEGGCIIVGEFVEGTVAGVTTLLLFCHTCGSTYLQPADVACFLIPTLKLDYPTAVQPGDPGFIGMGVAWTAVPTAPTWTTPHRVTARG